MTDREERKQRLREKAREAAKAADQLLEAELATLRAATLSDLEQLRPRVSDSAAYEQLLAAVSAATQQNESVALLKTRLHALGKRVLEASSEAVRLLA
jgi:hypothetical protein